MTLDALALDTPARNDRMVETMRMTADGLQLTAYGPVEGEIRIVEDLPKAKTPHESEALQRQIAFTDRQIDELVYELYGLTKDEIRVVEGAADSSRPTADGVIGYGREAVRSREPEASCAG